MRCFKLSSLTQDFFRPVSLALAGMLCLEVEPTFAQPPGGSLERPQEGGFRRGRFGGGDGVSLSSALRDEKFAEKLALTEDQKKKLEQLRMDMFTAFRSGASREEMPNIMKEFEQKAVDVLSAEQKQIWEVRKEELKVEVAARDAERGGTGRGPGGEQRGPGGSRDAVSPTPKPAPRRTDFVDEKPPEGATVTATFGPRVADASAGGGKVPNPADDKHEGPKLAFNFRYAPWADVLKLFSEAANLTLDLNDVPPGTFNYFDEKTYTVTEALDVLNGYLLPKGFVLIRRDQFLVSLNIDNGIPPNLIPNITIEELPQRGANELLSIVIPLENLEADKVVGEVKELLGPQGKVSALKNTNSLALTETGSNINRIYRLLKAGTPMRDSKETEFRALPLKHISASEAERTVRRLFGLNTATTTTNNFPQMGFSPFGGGFGGNFGGGFGQPGFSGGSRDGRDGRGDDSRGRDGGGGSRTPTPSTGSTTPSPFAGKIQVTADTRTNSLLVTASAAFVKLVEDAVKTIDVDTDADGKKIVRNDSPAYLKAYLVPGGDATQVSRTLNALMPNLVVGEDSKSGKIHVWATKEEHAEMEKYVTTLAGEGGGGSVAVINLTKLDPIQATNTLKNLFVNDPRAPMIEPDAFGRRLLVRGSADQLAQVKILLTQLGEAGNDPLVENVDRGNTRTLNLRGHDPQDILPLIEKMWEAGNRNSIRVVVPSQTSPIRDRRVPSAKSDGAELPLPGRGGNPIDQSGGKVRSTLRPVPARDTAPPQTNASRRSSILQVSRSGQARDVTDDAPNTVTTSTTDVLESTAPEQSTEKATDNKGAANEPPPIGIMIRGDEVIVNSEDKEALDRFESMYDTLVGAIPNRTRWTIFYLRTADATETAQMLERLFPQSSVTASTSSSEGLFGSMTSGLSTLGRGMMNVTGLNQTLGGGGSLRIITDTRANALFVTGPPDTIREVEQMLEILDLAELPTDSLRDRSPRTIPVEFAEIDEVLEIVESVFKDAIAPDPQQQPGGQGQRFNPLAMLMGGGGGGGAGAGGRKQSGPELAVTADRRTSHLIVFCNDAMFRQVDGLVESIDVRARDSRQTVRIMRLETADPSLVSETLTSLIPKVSVSASKGGTRKKSNDPNAAAGQPGQQAPDATRDAEMLRRAMEQRSQSRGGGGGFPGGGSPGGGGGGFGGGGRGGGGGGFGGGGRGGR
jgi:type II secretory pathway component GspD/PulD (secretin)